MVAVEKHERGAQNLDLEADALLGAEAREVGAQGVGRRRVVLEYECAVHALPPFI